MVKAAAIATVTVFLEVTCAIAFDATFETRYQTDSLRPLNMPARFDHGYLAVYEGKGIGIYAASGALQYRIPNPPKVTMTNVAVDKDGTAATVGSSSDGKGALWLWNSAGSNIRVIQTPNYVPSYVTFAPDGSIWTTGTQIRSNRHTDEDYAILRHFSREGALIGAYLSRSSFQCDREPALPVVALPALRIANSRIGMYFSWGGSRNDRVWIEADLNGKEVGRWRLDSVNGTPFAFTEAGEVYLQSMDGIYRLDRVTGKWIVTSVAAPGTLVGADGGALVFADRVGPSVYRVPAP